MDQEQQVATNYTQAIQEDTNSYRWIENGHILLWLIKDTCWAMEWRPGGLFMITPTLGVALYILWRSRNSRPDFFHNIAVCLWITANSVWMTGEFFKLELRPYAVVIFIIGLIILAVYYLLFFHKDKREAIAAVVETPAAGDAAQL